MPYNETSKTIHSTAEYGITLYDIARGLNDYRVDTNGARNLGMLATSPKINKWAKYQPFESIGGNPYGVQTEEDRQYSAYGYHWWNVTMDEDAPFELSAYHLFEKAVGLTDHNWKKKEVTIFRQADFDGYCHAAVMPYTYANESSDRDHNKVLRLNVASPVVGNLLIEDFPDVFNSQIANFEVKCIYRRRGTTDVKVESSSYYVGDLVMSNYAEVSFRVPPTVMGEPHVYDYLWVATNKDDSGADRIAWFFLPNGYGTFTYDGYYRVQYAYDTDYLPSPFAAINVNGYVVTSAEHEVKSLKLVLEAFHNFNYEAEGKLILHVWGREQGWDSGKDYEIDAMDDGATLFDINIEDAISGYVRADDTLMALSVYVRDAREPITTSPNYTSYHFDFENNKLALEPATVSDGISVWRMMEIRNNFRQ